VKHQCYLESVKYTQLSHLSYVKHISALWNVNWSCYDLFQSRIYTELCEQLSTDTKHQSEGFELNTKLYYIYYISICDGFADICTMD